MSNKDKIKYQYIKITLMYGNQEQGSFCELIDKPINFYDFNETGETTKQSGEWFKIEFVSMTKEEYESLPEFEGF